MIADKIERDMKVAKAENNVIKFAWISIVIGVVMIILGNVFDDNPFIDFISAALPWVLLGLMVLFAILYLNKENDNWRDELIVCKSMITATKQLFYAMEIHKLLHFENADMSAVSFAMTVHGLMDYELDQKYGYDEEPKNLLDEYLKWFCTENQVEAGD